MLLTDEIKLSNLRKKINTFFDLERYLDFLFLTFDDFTEKYKGYGWSFRQFYCLRFEQTTTIFSEITQFLPPKDQYYFVVLQSNGIVVYQKRSEAIEVFLEENPENRNFLIIEPKMTWLLVYDKHRKLYGLGGFIKKKMKKNVTFCFGKTPIMFLNTDEL
jgi:hypothetical protein